MNLLKKQCVNFSISFINSKKFSSFSDAILKKYPEILCKELCPNRSKASTLACDAYCSRARPFAAGSFTCYCDMVRDFFRSEISLQDACVVHDVKGVATPVPHVLDSTFCEMLAITRSVSAVEAFHPGLEKVKLVSDSLQAKLHLESISQIGAHRTHYAAQQAWFKYLESQVNLEFLHMARRFTVAVDLLGRAGVEKFRVFMTLRHFLKKSILLLSGSATGDDEVMIYEAGVLRTKEMGDATSIICHSITIADKPDPIFIELTNASCGLVKFGLDFIANEADVYEATVCLPVSSFGKFCRFVSPGDQVLITISPAAATFQVGELELKFSCGDTCSTVLASSSVSARCLFGHVGLFVEAASLPSTTVRLCLTSNVLVVEYKTELGHLRVYFDAVAVPAASTGGWGAVKDLIKSLLN